MNPINHKIKEQGEKFEKQVRPHLAKCMGGDFMVDTTGIGEKIISFLTQSQHELLDTVVSVLEEEKKRVGDKSSPHREYNKGYNKGITRAIQLLKEGKE